MSLQENPEKIKVPGSSFWESDRLFVAALLIAVALVSFGLGRWSAAPRPADRAPAMPAAASVAAERELQEEEAAPAAPVEAGEPAAPAGGMYVGSKNSNKYHLPWCAGARSISEANKVWFSSKEEAEAAGYVPASNCKGI